MLTGPLGFEVVVATIWPMVIGAPVLFVSVTGLDAVVVLVFPTIELPNPIPYGDSDRYWYTFCDNILDVLLT